MFSPELQKQYTHWIAKLHSAEVRFAFSYVKFNFVHFSLGHPWECCMSQVKHDDTDGKNLKKTSQDDDTTL